ncbi:MAG: helix-turn-helix domain-containing protein [Defluviitaleaceae bacterium]|nr:helix-turn-helix domain-containing protein [Defluviitaleaceae bacterium]
MLFIAENLKALRKNRGWTQEEMAETIGVSPQSISKWERGDTHPDIALLPALANLFRVSIDAIIGMDKINETEARAAIFKAGQAHLRNGDNAAAADIYASALKTFPGDEDLMSELALALSLDDDPAKLKQAANYCERVLSGNPSEKVRHTTRAAICFIYFKMGEKEKAIAAAGNLPHARESRENILAELRGEPDANDINSYLKFIALGESDNQDKILVDFGINMVEMCTEHDLAEKIKGLRAEIGAPENHDGLRKLPHIRIRDNLALPPNRARIAHYGDLLLDKDFPNAKDAANHIIATLRKIAQK